MYLVTNNMWSMGKVPMTNRRISESDDDFHTVQSLRTYMYPAYKMPIVYLSATRSLQSGARRTCKQLQRSYMWLLAIE